MQGQRTSISIAMAVYNGERFIRQQLDSFIGQTRLPDELVVSDNASTDRTVEVVREFAARAPFPVRLYINQRNLGVTKNFERAISECTGDIIFLSDCDDVWYPIKVAAMERAMTEWPEAVVALCDADIADEEMGLLGHRLWEENRFAPSLRLRRAMAAGKTFKRSVPTLGNCMAFRAALKSIILPLPDGDLFQSAGQDVFIAWTLFYSGMGGIICINRPLLAYRQHPGQATGAGAHRSTAAFLAGFFAQRKERSWTPLFAAVSERLESIDSHAQPITPDMRSAVLRHWRARACLPANRVSRIPIIARELLTMRYHRFSRGALTALKDLLFVE